MGTLQAFQMFLILTACCVPAVGQSSVPSIQTELQAIASKSLPAIAMVEYVSRADPEEFGVAGTAFFVRSSGDFITATEIFTKYSKYDLKLAWLSGDRLQFGDFKIIDRDEYHKIALCRPSLQFGRREASLSLSTSQPKSGTLVAVSGFTTGTVNPILRLSMVAATRSYVPLTPTEAAPGEDLLQIALTTSDLDAGSPVIELDSGTVIGVLIRDLKGFFSSANRSFVGPANAITFAAPASAVASLLARNKAH